MLNGFTSTWAKKKGVSPQVIAQVGGGPRCAAVSKGVDGFEVAELRQSRDEVFDQLVRASCAAADKNSIAVAEVLAPIDVVRNFH